MKDGNMAETVAVAAAAAADSVVALEDEKYPGGTPLDEAFLGGGGQQ